MEKYKELNELLLFSLTRKTGKKEVSLGKPSRAIISFAKKHNIDLRGFEILLDSFAVRHSFNRHGVKSPGVKRGQMPICVFDVLLLPELLKVADIIAVTQETILLSKKGFGTIGEIVLEIRISNRKGQRLYIKTMYNKKRSGNPAPFKIPT